ncbi:hypothetical protein Tco_1113617 [Tanacetum coccineum]|uniref:Uncharacterized protein n=1 Tax=Tanacetum coccineum TaxID=301880 RepID=A0ABQ5ISS8_9ASTR
MIRRTIGPSNRLSNFFIDVMTIIYVVGTSVDVMVEKFHLCLKEEMVDDLRYFNSLEHEVDSLKSQLETQKTQFLNEIDRLSKEYYYADHMNAILGMYTNLDEFTDLQCDYVDQVVKCERVIPTTSVSRPQLKSNQLEDSVMHNNSLGKKQQVEDHRRNKEVFPLLSENHLRERTGMPSVVVFWQ